MVLNFQGKKKKRVFLIDHASPAINFKPVLPQLSRRDLGGAFLLRAGYITHLKRFLLRKVILTLESCQRAIKTKSVL